MALYSFIALSFLPLIILLAPYYIEPYQLWDPIALNDKIQGERQTRWCNMGWWENTDSFPIAAKSLAEKLLDFAKEGGYSGGGNVLVLHLNSTNPPKHLHGLTSLTSDTKTSQILLDKYKSENINTKIELFTYSAKYNPTKDFNHPLNKMKGFMGEKNFKNYNAYLDEDEILEVEEEQEQENYLNYNKPPPPPYDLIYILDSIYHYPPSIISFLNSLKPITNKKNKSIIIYTDILPPPPFESKLNKFKFFFISYFLSIPISNLLNRPKSLLEYKNLLENQGWIDVEIQDWSQNVWKGFANNLKNRGGKWEKVGKTVDRARKDGWKFVAVRIKKGDL
uniref:Uncharacterized protein n=1 Tax=Kwoniella pini CBS 10737 TaxID=1296096 RepID=A0A1B9I6L3_9TREE|nr:uncharacterized protein I206_03242 [Kwoniella pini CBS 10737]OCF51176.1 hypothetical protein I206_03242 [Kwoniella pini CBS 10737]